MKYSKTQLALQHSQSPVKCLFFWGNRQRLAHRIDTSCLSPWFVAPFVVGSQKFPTLEHYLVYKKAGLFKGNEVLQERIMKTLHAGQLTRMHSSVLNFNEAIWLENIDRFLLEGCYEKFSQNESLKEFLLGTGDKALIKANPRETLFSIGIAENHTSADQIEKWPGKNLLGFALMEVRDRLKES